MFNVTHLKATYAAWSEPATTANQITYDYFCTLGGLSNPRCSKVMRHNGTHTYATYHLASY